MSTRTSTESTNPQKVATEWRAHELLLMTEVMRLVGKSLAPEIVLREMLHLISDSNSNFQQH